MWTYYSLFWLDVELAHFSSGSGKLTLSHIIAHWEYNFELYKYIWYQ